MGRYDIAGFDFSAKRVVASVDESLERMGVDYIDLIQCHDIELDRCSQRNDTRPTQSSGTGKGRVCRHHWIAVEDLSLCHGAHRGRYHSLLLPLFLE